MSERVSIGSDDFDWVSARAQCTPFNVFQQLRFQVQGDTNKRNSLTSESGVGANFTIEAGPEWFSVACKSLGQYRGVTFSLSANGIQVLDASTTKLLHDGALTISNDGRCRLKVGAAELDLWQFRKLALQDLFFLVERQTP